MVDLRYVLILVCVEVSVGECEEYVRENKSNKVLILVCVEVSVGDRMKIYLALLTSGLNPCLCGS